MYDGAGAQRIVLNFKSLSPPNLCDPFLKQNFNRRPYARHKILKSTEILKLAARRKFQARAVYKFQNLAV